jgi:hypothetical protein
MFTRFCFKSERTSNQNRRYFGKVFYIWSFYYSRVSFCRLNHPAQLKEIYDMKTEQVINSAIDFTEDAKPRLIQFILVPKETSSTALIFDMEFKSQLSKAILSLVSFSSYVCTYLLIVPFRILKN